MGISECRQKCSDFEPSSKQFTYENGGCYCRNCDYYFKEKFLRCPCCNTRVRYSTRSNKRRLESEVIRL